MLVACRLAGLSALAHTMRTSTRSRNLNPRGKGRSCSQANSEGTAGAGRGGWREFPFRPFLTICAPAFLS